MLTSAKTPEPGVGSVPSDLPLTVPAASDVLLEASVYSMTQAGALIAIFNKANALPGVDIVISAYAVCAIDPVAALVVVLYDKGPVAPCAPADPPEPAAP